MEHFADASGSMRHGYQISSMLDGLDQRPMNIGRSGSFGTDAAVAVVLVCKEVVG